MEEILKSLQGKSMTKKSLFDFLSDINLENISSSKPTNTIVYDDIVIHPIKEDLVEEVTKEKKRRGRPKIKPQVEEVAQEKKPQGRPKIKPQVEEVVKEKKRRGRKPKIKTPVILNCTACMKVFSSQLYFEYHLTNSTVCKKWNELTEKPPMINHTKGIHLIVDDLLEKAITDINKLECKFCKYVFSIKGNLHKHYNSSTLCNIMAFDEFKKLINNYNNNNN